MKGFKVFVKDRSQTDLVAKVIASHLAPGDVLLFMGDLGAGKTHMIREILAGLGVDKALVTSPTFAIVHTFEGDAFPCVHADLYRLGPEADLSEIGLLEFMGDGKHCVFVEWGDYLGESDKEGLPILEIWLYFPEKGENSEERIIEFKTEDLGWQDRLGPLYDELKRGGLHIEGTHS